MSDIASRPTCTVKAGYWREGMRWKVVLQVMYNATPGRGQGPFFAIGHTLTESAARAMVEEANARLASSEVAMLDVIQGMETAGLEPARHYRRERRTA